MKPSDSDPVRGALRVLIVEDDAIVARDLQAIMEELGHRVRAVVHSGQEAVRTVRNMEVDLVLMDIRLPGDIDGIDATAAITKEKRVPVVYITAHTDQGILARVGATESYGFVVKPFEEKDLEHAVALALRRHRLARSWNEAEKEEALGRLAGRLCHQFNNLLTVIQGNAEEVLARPLLDDAVADAVRIIREAAREGGELTSELLTAIGSGRAERQAVQAGRLLEEVAAQVKRKAPEGVSVDMQRKAPTRVSGGVAEPDGDPDPVIHADPVQLKAALLELAMNALDAMSGDGVLRLGVTSMKMERPGRGEEGEIPPGRYVALEVRDSGPGIPNEIRGRILEPYFTTRPGKLGLGLSRVRGIVKGNGGYLAVETRSDEGTTVRIFHPAARGPSTTPVPPVEGKGASLRGTEVILVADDDDGVRKVACRILQRFGYIPLPAEDGRSALQIWEAEGNGIHLILTDIVMPEMDGLDLIQRIRAQDPDASILAMSGHVNPDDLVAGRIPADIPLVSKPFSANELLTAVRTLLNRGSAGEIGTAPDPGER